MMAGWIEDECMGNCMGWMVGSVMGTLIDGSRERERAKDGFMATEWIGGVEGWVDGWRGWDGWTDG